MFQLCGSKEEEHCDPQHEPKWGLFVSTLILQYLVCSNLAVPAPHFRCPIEEQGTQQAAFPMLPKASAPTRCAKGCRVPLRAGPLPESAAGSEALHQHTWEMGLWDHEIQPSAGAQRESHSGMMPLFLPVSHLHTSCQPEWCGMQWCRVRDGGCRSTAVRAEPPSFPTPTTAATAHSGSSTTQQGETKGPAQLCLCWRENSDPFTKALIKNIYMYILKSVSNMKRLVHSSCSFPPSYQCSWWSSLAHPRCWLAAISLVVEVYL